MNFPTIEEILAGSPPKGDDVSCLVADYPNVPVRNRLDDWQRVRQMVERFVRPFQLPQEILSLLEEMSAVTTAILVRNLPLEWLLAHVVEPHEDDMNDPFWEPPVMEIMTAKGTVYDVSGTVMDKLPDQLMGKLQFGDMIEFESTHQASGLYFVGLDGESLVQSWKADVGTMYDFYCTIPRTITCHMDDAGFKYNWHNGFIHGCEIDIFLNPTDMFLKVLMRTRREYEDITEVFPNAKNWLFCVRCRPRWSIRVEIGKDDPITHTFPLLDRDGAPAFVMDDIIKWYRDLTMNYYASL